MSTTLLANSTSVNRTLPSTGIVGLRPGDYIYVKVNASVYCFCISKTAATTSGSVSVSSGSIGLVNGQATVTLNLNGTAYGVRAVAKEDFKVGALEITKLTIDGNVITLILEMGTASTAGSFAVTYIPRSTAYIMDGAGNKPNLNRTLTNNFPSPSPTPTS
jgi:hypothetical protein